MRPRNEAAIARAIHEGAGRLRASGVDSPRLEARLLLAHALGVDVADLVANPDRIVGVTDYDALIGRRATHEPLAYLTGHREFWSLDFLVSPATLVPRPESETIVRAALARRPGRVLDLGTGSGCLLLAVLNDRAGAWGIGVDRSREAVRVAARNAARFGLADRAAFLVGDWASAVAGRFDLVLSNPPYIRSGDIAGLMEDVAGFEPRAALDGGADGLDAYRAIIADLHRLLTPDGAAVLELGVGQAEPVSALARSFGFAAHAEPDLAGIPRALVLCRA